MLLNIIRTSLPFCDGRFSIKKYAIDVIYLLLLLLLLLSISQPPVHPGYFLLLGLEIPALPMPKKDFSCAQIASLLADKIIPDFNYDEQLWFIARSNDREARNYLCLLLRTQFDFQPSQQEKSFFHECLNDYGFDNHKPFRVIIHTVSFQV